MKNAIHNNGFNLNFISIKMLIAYIDFCIIA